MKNKLKIMLKDIIKIIEGPWFVADGALLGIMREGDLLDFDDDVDIYVLPETKLNWDKLPEKYKHHKDYMLYKIYDREDKVPSENEWLRFISYKLTLFEFYGYNRAQITEAIAPDYKSEKITRQHANLWIDIIELVHDVQHDLYRLNNHWNGREFYFTPDECKSEINNSLGFDINIPKDPENVLNRIYGSTWEVEDRCHVY